MKERLIKIRDKIEEGQSLIDSAVDILEELYDEIQDFNLIAYREGDKIKVESDIPFNELQFKVGDNHVSVQGMLHSGFEPAPPPLPAREYYIGNIDINQKFEIKAGTGGWDGDSFVFDRSETVILPEKEKLEPVGKLDIFTAFWGSNDVPDNDLKRLMTAGIHKSPNERPLRQIQEYGHKIIAYIGLDKGEDETEREIRQQVSQRHDKFQQIGYHNFEFIILDDEPFRSGYTTQQLEWMVDEAQKLYEVPVTFMFMEYHLKRQELPKNLKLVGVNLYPLKKQSEDGTGHTQAWNYQEFKEITDSAFANAYEQLDDPKFVITAQIFGTRDGSSGPQWRMPTKAELEWYFRYASENRDVTGLAFWKWNSEPDSKYEGLSTRPELQKALEELLIKYTEVTL